MGRHLGLIALLVRDYDEAIAFYVGRLGFDLVEDSVQSSDKRWVVVSPPGATETGLLLALPAGDRQRAAIGDQAGGRVFLFLRTDDFQRDYRAMRENGIAFLEDPRIESYGTVAVFQDLYGNRWDLIEHKSP